MNELGWKQWLAMLLTVGAILAGVIWLEVYHFHDCRRVGHTLAYCVIDIFR